MSTAMPLLLAYYGDDFTGSTDALEFLARAGLRAALFIAPPTPEQMARYAGLQAVGVAGLSRSLAPEPMDAELRPAFTALRALGAAHVHYKVCSTFDSAPHVGSIGRAIDVGADVFRAAFVPLLVAAPALGRYCAFGNLFARMGIGSAGEIFRLDRHPSMSRHPVTPADESDLRRHLARQTTKAIGLLDVLQIAGARDAARGALDALRAAGAEIVLFDAVYPEQLAAIGSLIDAHATAERPLFSVGSSGIEMALGACWAEQGRVRPISSWAQPGEVSPLLVISGSCSPVTERQIAWALAHGFAEVPLATDRVASDDAAGAERDATTRVSELLAAGKSVIVHTSRGVAEARFAALQGRTAPLFGGALGRVARAAIERGSVRRLLIAGGDSSSYAARALGIESVEMIAPLAPGAPLCRARAPGSPAEGLEVNFKGGQVGAEDYFGAVVRGHR